MKTYSDILTRTSAEDVPWYVTPADNRWFIRHAVGRILCEHMGELDSHYPEIPVGARHKTDGFKKALLDG